MEIHSPVLRRLAEGDASALASFYNALSSTILRVFRPLGEKTSLEICQQIVTENGGAGRKRFDLVCCQGAEILGWAFVMGLDSAKPELGIGLSEIIQGQGIGKALFSKVLDWARAEGIQKVYLIVVTDNLRAIHLYQSHGFVIYDDKIDEADQLPYFHMVAELN